MMDSETAPGNKSGLLVADHQLSRNVSTTAETHLRTLKPIPSFPNFGRWFIFKNDRFRSPVIRSRMS